MNKVEVTSEVPTFNDLALVLRNHSIAPVVAGHAQLRNTCHALHATLFVARKKYGIRSVREVVLPKKVCEVFVDFVSHLKALDASLEISVTFKQ